MLSVLFGHIFFHKAYRIFYRKLLPSKFEVLTLNFCIDRLQNLLIIHDILSLEMFGSVLRSVANAAVYPLNWATLKLLAAKKKKNGCQADGLKFGYFSCLPAAALFFKFASFLSIQRVFEPFQWPRTFFLSISGIKTSWRAINIDYPLHTEVNSLHVFPLNWVILIISKAPKFGSMTGRK